MAALGAVAGLVLAPRAVDAKCRTLAELRARFPDETPREEPLRFVHLKAQARRLTYVHSKDPPYVVVGDRACPFELEAVAPLFSPYSSPAEVDELIATFEPGERIARGRLDAVLAALEAAGLLVGADVAGVKRSVAGELPGAAGYSSRLVLARTLDDGAELVRVTLQVSAAGIVTRAESPIVRITAPPELAGAFASSSPVAGPARSPAARPLLAAHEQRLQRYWAAIATGR